MSDEARVCICGCVKFSLLKDGNIECSECLTELPSVTWCAQNVYIKLDMFKEVLKFGIDIEDAADKANEIMNKLIRN